MCGIAGYCGPARRFDEAKLRRMLRALAHRGPDDEGMYLASTRDGEYGVWLGSRRLAVQDLSPAGHQPMARGGQVIVFNGEIYNFLELRARLEREGEAFRSRCDTEVALAAWNRGGMKAAASWRGMFAAAVWDEGAEEFWLVRDPWGIKPLYYHWDGAGIAFASEVRALRAGGAAPAGLSRRGVADYLRFGAPQDPVTILDEVYALLPGHALRWRGGRIERTVFAGEQEEPMRAEEVGSALGEIVRQQMISDAPLVVFLSGGVDSSVVALLAREAGGAEVHTLTVAFEERQYTEAPFARRVAERLGTAHHEVFLRAGEARETALEAISRMDQPTIDGLNTYVVSRAARRCGFTVALSGLGGDEFFGGYPSFRRAALVARVRQWARRAPEAAAAAGSLIGGWGRRARRLGEYLENGDFEEHPYYLQRTIFFSRQIERLWRAGRDCGEAERMAAERRRWVDERAASMDPLNQVSWLEARNYMGNMLLRDADQMSMAHSLELRVPLVDQVLAGRLLATPGPQKGLGGRGKPWLERAFRKSLPDEVFSRKKAGFLLPMDPWLRGPLRREVEGTLAGNPGDLWDRGAALEVWERFLRGEINWARPWALYVLSRWAGRRL